jgi:hypothetical protein
MASQLRHHEARTLFLEGIRQNPKEEFRMFFAKQICTALLLLCMLVLAGCPEVAQDNGGSSQSSGAKGD